MCQTKSDLLIICQAKSGVSCINKYFLCDLCAFVASALNQMLIASVKLILMNFQLAQLGEYLHDQRFALRAHLVA